MKNIFWVLIFTALLTTLASSSVFAQEHANFEDQNPRRAGRPFKIMKELDLTREQIQQIRSINQERRPIMQAAAQRWQIARRKLDEAIYADYSSEEKVRELTRSAQLAQSELLKERTLTEYLIRNVLTPDQLVKFRQLRGQLMRRGNNNPENTDDEAPRPLNRFERRKPNRGQ